MTASVVAADSNKEGGTPGCVREAGAGPIGGSVKKHRAAFACNECNRKKTKCDVNKIGTPCTKCKSASVQCELVESRRGRYKRKKVNSDNTSQPDNTSQTMSNQGRHDYRDDAAHLLAIISDGSTATETSNHSSESTQAARTSSFTPWSLSIPVPSMMIGDQAFGNMQDPHAPSSVFFEPHDSSGQQDYPHTLPTSAPGTSSFTPQISTTLNCERDAEHNIQAGRQATAPEREAQASQGVSQHEADEWTELMGLAPDHLDVGHGSRNIVYASDTFTLAHLLHRHWGEAGAREKLADRVHFPGRPVVSQPSVEWSAASTNYLSALGCLTIPPKSAMDEMIGCYFEFFHPTYPIICKTQFYTLYENVLTGGVSLLQLWGMLYISATLCPLDCLTRIGFSTRFEALRVISLRGKALQHTHFEPDRVINLIFEFLMSQCWSDGEDAFEWAGRASLSAQAMGMHRTTSKSRLHLADQRLWRRLWWSIYIRDRHSAAATGRPCRISEQFNDVELPQEADFEQRDDYLHFYYSTTLAKIVTQVIECRLVDASKHNILQQAACYQSLQAWLNSLPPELSANHTSVCIHTAFLHISYHCWVVHLFRPGSAEEQHNSIASSSATAATRLFEDLLVQNRVKQCPQFGVTCLFAAMSTLWADKHSQDKTVRMLSSNRFQVCMVAAEALGEVRPTAAWFLRMFTYLERKDAQRAKSMPGNMNEDASHTGDSGMASITIPELDAAAPGIWDDLFWGLPGLNETDQSADWLRSTQ